MGLARSHKIDLQATPFYHCISRCVRRSYLCGVDAETGQDYSHRKTWMVNRMKHLASIFAIQICAYAVMSNHYHTVLFVNKLQEKAWDDEQVKSRWASLFPLDAKKFEELNLSAQEMEMKHAIWRKRLTSISWFMRCLNEPLARLSNLEDNCTGRFWEGRFKSQALLDEGALLSAMVYVDLNPIRARIASTPETSEFTSIYERIKEVAKSLNSTYCDNQPSSVAVQSIAKHCDSVKQPASLMAFSNGQPFDKHLPKIEFRLSDYLGLVDTTGRIIREDKRGAIPEGLSSILFRLHLTSKGWVEMVNNLEKRFTYVIGSETSLQQFGQLHRKRVLKGVLSARKYYLEVA